MSLPASREALDEVFSLTYEELRRLARCVLRSDSVQALRQPPWLMRLG